MTTFGFHASHEQVHPSKLLEAVVQAEQAGFSAAMCSDHLAPWSRAQGQSAYAFAWLGAALQATQRLPFGSFHAPGQRYHPVVSAQAVATLAAMFPGRYPWIALGSGEALNEHATGGPWPPKETRVRRLRECADVMRALLAGEEVTHEGLVSAHRARLWTLPQTPPLLVAGAVSVESAGRAAQWADGLITVNQPLNVLREIVDTYRSGGGRGRLFLQVHLSYAPTDDDALGIAVEQWRTNCLPGELAWELETPEQFEAATRFVPPEEVRRQVLVSADPDRHAAWLQEFVELGFDALFLHHVGREQQEFIDVFGTKVLPQFNGVPA